jgi:hypothetical protein
MGRENLKGDGLWGMLKFGSNALWTTYDNPAYCGDKFTPADTLKTRMGKGLRRFLG